MRGSNVDYIILNIIHSLPNMNKITLNLQSGYETFTYFYVIAPYEFLQKLGSLF